VLGLGLMDSWIRSEQEVEFDRDFLTKLLGARVDVGTTGCFVGLGLCGITTTN
jgi:hypothetical protein